MTLNVQNTTAGDPRRVQLLNDAIRRVAPYVISLQEVMSTDHLEVVLDGTGLNGTHQSEVLGYEPPFVDKYGGTAVATRWPHRIVETLDQRLTDAPDVPWGAHWRRWSRNPTTVSGRTTTSESLPTSNSIAATEGRNADSTGIRARRSSRLAGGVPASS